MQAILTEQEIPEDGRAFFLLQKEFTDLYLRLYQQKDKAVIAEEFNSYMKKMEAGEGARDTLSFCVCYFGEFLQVMAEEERWDDIIRIGNYIKNARNFSGSFCPVYKLMRTAACRSDRKSFGDRYRNSRECIWRLWRRRRRITTRWYVSLPGRSFGLNA